MGKDYSTDRYKKTYESEYIRSYERSRDEQAAYDEQRTKYEAISKKRGTRSYSKSEKDNNEDWQPTPVNNKDRVNAEGNKPATRPKTRKVTVAADTNSPETRKPIKEVPPPFVEERKTAQTDRATAETTSNAAASFRTETFSEQKRVDDYGYIDKRSTKMPVLPLHGDKYRNMYTREEIDGREARRILEYAGYAPTPKTDLWIYAIIGMLVAVAIGILGPIVLGIWGYMLSKKKTVIVRKKHGITLRCKVPINSEEIVMYSQIGSFHLVMAILIVSCHVWLMTGWISFYY